MLVLEDYCMTRSFLSDSLNCPISPTIHLLGKQRLSSGIKGTGYENKGKSCWAGQRIQGQRYWSASVGCLCLPFIWPTDIKHLVGLPPAPLFSSSLPTLKPVAAPRIKRYSTVNRKYSFLYKASSLQIPTIERALLLKAYATGALKAERVILSDWQQYWQSRRRIPAW